MPKNDDKIRAVISGYTRDKDRWDNMDRISGNDITPVFDLVADLRRRETEVNDIATMLGITEMEARILCMSDEAAVAVMETHFELNFNTGDSKVDAYNRYRWMPLYNELRRRIEGASYETAKKVVEELLETGRIDWWEPMELKNDTEIKEIANRCKDGKDVEPIEKFWSAED